MKVTTAILDDDIRPADVQFFSEWHSRREEIAGLAEQLLESPAFKRLGSITFLGILSPRFADRAQSPLYKRRHDPLTFDGSRESHSLGVALIALDMTRFLRFSELAQRYAVAWALLHDIGNWPLAHTGEYAFSRITRLTTREVRKLIITGDRRVPSHLRLDRVLESMGLERDKVLMILRHETSGLTGELRRLSQLLSAAINPDALEGMWRASLAFGEVKVPHPRELTRSFLRDLFADINLNQASSKAAIRFWRGQADIYRKYINRRTVMQWESAWSRAIMREFRHVTLTESLELSEDHIVNAVLAAGVPNSKEVYRYKEPIEYTVEPPRRRSISSHAALDELATVLTKRRMDLGKVAER